TGVDDATRLHAKAGLRQELELAAERSYRAAGGHLTEAQARENAAVRMERAFDNAVRRWGADQAGDKFGDEYYRHSGLRSWDLEHAWRAAHPEQAARVHELRRAIDAARAELDRLPTDEVTETHKALDGYTDGLRRQIDRAPEQGGLNESAVDSLRNA